MTKKMNNTIHVPGFLFGGIHCGIKDKASKKDIGIIYSEQPQTNIAGDYTLNQVCAAPVKLCQKNGKNGKGQLIVINSGIANAATGKKGMQDLQNMMAQAKQGGIPR